MELIKKIIPDIKNFRIGAFGNFMNSSEKDYVNDAQAIQSDFIAVLGDLETTAEKYENGEIKAPTSSK